MVGSEESYGSVECRIQEAIVVLLQKGEENPNLAAAAREFNLPPQSVRARWNGRESKEKRVPANRRLMEEEELAVCQYLDRLDHIGSSARLNMITTCANAIRLHVQKDQSIPTPVVSEHWSRRFLARHPEYHIRKQYTLDANRKNAHSPERYWIGSVDMKKSAINKVFSQEANIILTKQAFGLELDKISG